ncbi:serine hydrolase [Tissierella sp. Yu-01]|uniref:serine hydrolase n=1 Tax=Tissierella sp. Yu-01 TaxID=3035694 RepID=UPI00240DF864|nr:serine hydrolase [Tissierella sp. Yu-01]WFA10057.1 class A beta-lactamase-related serine hydrolase [Tissierella sp. Yu-01]
MTLNRLDKDIFSTLSDLDGIVGLYFEDLNSGKKITINADLEFSAASTIKIPLVTLLFKKAQKGEINLNEKVIIDESNRVGGSGIIKELDSDYTPTIIDLAKLAIVLSDNVATNQLIDIVGGADEVTNFCNDMNLKSTRLQRKMMDFESLKAGKDNYTTPSDMGYLLKLLANDEFKSEDVSKGVINIMKRQQLNQKLPYLIPALEPDDPNIDSNTIDQGTVVVAHKTGELDRVQHDVGVFLLPNGHKYILAIYTKNLSTDSEGIKAIANLSKVVYDCMVETVNGLN